MRSHEDSGAAGTIAPEVQRVTRKGLPPSASDVLGALTETRHERGGKKAKKSEKPGKVRAKDRTRPLNFRVTPKFRRAFKQAAASRHCKKVELLEQIFIEWSSHEAG